jgi:preprotein translocase SecF subunit
MFNLVEKRRWYFILSAFIIVPGLAILIYSTITTGAPFRLSIDFQGGSIYDATFLGGNPSEGELRDIFTDVTGESVIIQRLGQPEYRWSIVDIAIENQDNLDAVREEVESIFQASAIGGDIAIEVGEDDNEFILTFSDPVLEAEETLRETFGDVFDEDTTLEEATLTRWSIRGTFLDDATLATIEERLEEEIAPIDRETRRIEVVSATIGSEVTRAAFFAVGAAALVITGFIVIAFRQIPKARRYGICAITAMVHDVLIVMGVMSLMGLIAGWEVDALFLTAVLTVVGFSVQDSIVVFDRIRENIPRHLGEPYETIVNRSVWETIHRSLATQLNAFFIMIAILLFGGETVQQFIFILFIGLLSGSYSSLFTAVPLLVSWEKGELPFLNKESKLQEAA